MKKKYEVSSMKIVNRLTERGVPETDSSAIAHELQEWLQEDERGEKKYVETSTWSVRASVQGEELALTAHEGREFPGGGLVHHTDNKAFRLSLTLE